MNEDIKYFTHLPSPRIKKNIFFMVMAFENVKQIGNGTNVLDFIINYTS